jgi:hypothetical protein
MISNSTTAQTLNKAKLKIGFSLMTIALLSACGGGGSSSTSPTPLTLNLNSAWEKRVKGGSSVTGTISGYCQGTRVWTLTSAYSGTTLDGKPALIENEYETDFMAANSNKFCTTYLYSSNNGGKVYQSYYDPKTIVPISSGSNPPSTVYLNQVPFPTSVSDGSSGIWHNTVTYENSVPVASGVQTWSVTADTSTTLMLITSDKAYTYVGKQLLYNQTNYYRINADNTLTNLRKNIQPTALLTGNGDQNIDEVYQQP